MADVSTNTQRLSEKGASRDETRHAEQSAFTAVNGAQECYLRMLDMAQENTVAGLDFARELASVKTPMEFVEVWNAGAREAFGTFSEQTKELSGLAQKVATSTVQPLTNGLTGPFSQVQ